MDIHADLVESHTGYDDISYNIDVSVISNFQSVFIATLDGFGSNFSGAAFFLSNQSVSFLF